MASEHLSSSSGSGHSANEQRPASPQKTFEIKTAVPDQLAHSSAPVQASNIEEEEKGQSSGLNISDIPGAEGSM